MSVRLSGGRKPLRPYDEVDDLIGSVIGLSPDVSTTTGERLADIVREKVRKRGS